MNSKKTIVIVGQTSTGKSDFAVQVAKEINGEIISADSRQVYKGMNLGTGKITKKEMSGIKHYLLDVTSPSKVFSVNDFQKLGNKAIKEITKKGKVPIICGGTGFYIDSLLEQRNYPKVLPNKKFRDLLNKKNTESLFDLLLKLDPARAKNIDKNNKVRLIRAIEIAKVLGKVPQMNVEPQIPNIKIGLHMPPEILKELIRSRLLKRIKKGMIKEVEKLHKNGVSWNRMNSLGLEYRYVSSYLQNKLTKEEMVEKLNTEIWHYAKRQKTWFRRDKNIIWIDPRKEVGKRKAIKSVQNFLK